MHYIIINIYMLRIQLHIETMNEFSPKEDYTICGACNAAD